VCYLGNNSNRLWPFKMTQRHPGKRPPSHQPPAHSQGQPLNDLKIHASHLREEVNDLQTSTGNLREQIGKRKEQDRILAAIRQEREKNDHAGWISYDRLFRLIDEK